MDQIEVVALFLFVSLFLAVGYLSINQKTKSLTKKYWRVILVLVLANTATKIPYTSNLFDGLEYEDSYIYKASARAIYEGRYDFSKINPYYPTTCIYGSLEGCKMSGICVTNFLGYPYIVNLGYHLFGYKISTANIVSLIFSGLSIGILFLAALIIIDQLAYALICCFVYITIPIFNVYGSTSLTEPLSNAWLILVLLLYLAFIKSPSKGKISISHTILGLAAIVFSLSYSILVKTTNLSLIFCLPIAGLIYLAVDKEYKNRNSTIKVLITIPVILLLYIFGALVLKYQTAIEVNIGDIGRYPFSFSYFKSIAPVFLKSLFRFQWYLVYTPFLLIGIAYGIKKKKGILPIFLFLFYFILYTSHYRSYYFSKGFLVMEDEAIRYMISFISIYSLISGLGIYYLWQSIRKTTANRPARFIKKLYVPIISVVVLAVSMVLSFTSRAGFVEDEYNVRVAPVLETLRYLDSKYDTLITSEHILFQIYGNIDLNIIDFCSISTQIPLEEVDSDINTRRVYYLETMSRVSLDMERYESQFHYIDSKRKECIFEGEDYTLYRLLPE